VFVYTGLHRIQGTNSSVGHLHRVELSTVLRPRTRCDSETLGKGCTQLKVHRGTSIPPASGRFLKDDGSWVQYGLTEICVQLRRTSLHKLPLGMLARSLRGCSRSLLFLTSTLYVELDSPRSITDESSSSPQEEEVDQFYDSSGIAWKLTSKEAQAVAGLRI